MNPLHRYPPSSEDSGDVLRGLVNATLLSVPIWAILVLLVLALVG